MTITRQVINKSFPYPRDISQWLWPILTIVGLPSEITYKDGSIHIQLLVQSDRYSESFNKLEDVLDHVHGILYLASWPEQKD